MGGDCLGTAPTQQQSTFVREILRAMYKYTIRVIQLLLRVGSTQTIIYIVGLWPCPPKMPQR